MTRSATPSSAGNRHQPTDFGGDRGVGRVRLAADDQQPGGDLVVARQAGKTTDHVVHALARHHAPDVQYHRLIRREAERDAGEWLGQRPQFGRVEAAGNDRHLCGIGVIEVNQVFLVLRALGDQVIRLRDDPVFHGEAGIREVVGAALKLPPHAPERVKGDHKGDAKLLFDLRSDQPRHPEVGVHQVVRRFLPLDVA